MTFVPPETTAALSQPVLITHSPAPRTVMAVNGNYVVWVSNEEGRTNVVAYNLQTDQEKRFSRLPGGKGSVRLSERYVVWEDTLDEPNRYRTVVRGYDLATDQELAFGSEQIQRDPDVAGNIVVWSEPFHAVDPLAEGIYGYDLKAQRTFAIVTGLDRYGFPRVSGDWVIYFCWKRDPQTAEYSLQPTLRAHQIGTGDDIALGNGVARNDASCCDNHVISGSNVIWEAGDARLHFYDLAARQGHILDEPRRFGSFDLHGDILSLGSALMNFKTGSLVQPFQPFRVDRPAHIDSIATDGRTMAWIPDIHNGEVYMARLLQVP